MKRVKTFFADREVEFIDRDQAIKQVEELAERGTRFPLVVYGPEGCGKTAFFKQASEILREHGYAVVHVNPLARAVEDRFSVAEDLRKLAVELGAYAVGEASRLVDLAVELLYRAIKENIKKKIALLADDVFQAIGLDRAEQLVKSLLNMIEWPSIKYERIVVLIASSEGVTRGRVGRHNWATMRIMWNMTREGFKQLYEIMPDPKPGFDEVWRLSGGNPRYLEGLYRFNWSAEAVVDEIIRERGVRALARRWGADLGRAVDDPDYLWDRYPSTEALIRDLVQANLIIEVWDRKPYFWVGEPPPQKDPELGIGEEYAWQTPLHREAVRRALVGSLG